MSLLPHHQTAPTPRPESLLNAISELEQNKKAQIESRRGNNRIDLNCKVVVLPGNVSDRNGRQVEGSCRDISRHGCRLVLQVPITVGDVYYVSIQDPNGSLDPVFGRCVRCHMIREDAFEVGVSFFAPVTMNEITPGSNSDLDLDIG